MTDMLTLKKTHSSYGLWFAFLSLPKLFPGYLKSKYYLCRTVLLFPTVFLMFWKKLPFQNVGIEPSSVLHQALGTIVHCSVYNLLLDCHNQFPWRHTTDEKSWYGEMQQTDRDEITSQTVCITVWVQSWQTSPREKTASAIKPPADSILGLNL